MKTIHLILIAILLPLASFAQDTVNTAQLAAAAYINGLLDSAEVLSTQALAEKSTPERMLLSAQILFAKQQYADAARYYSAADKKKQASSGIKRAEAYSLAGAVDSAFAALDAYLGYSERVSSAKIVSNPAFENLKTDARWQSVINKKDINPYQKDLESAAHLIKTNRTANAFELLNGVIKKHPSCHRAWYLRACAYRVDNNNKSALDDIEHAIKLHSRDAEYWNLLAETQYFMQRYTKAADTWIAALKYNELSIDNYLYAATSYLMAKNYAAAEKYSRLYLVMFEHNTDAVSVLSESLACQGDGVAALRVLNTMPYKDASFYRSRGIIYLQSETYQFAIDDFNRAIDLDPTLYDIYLHRGMAYYSLGKKDDAKRDWNTAVKNCVYKANDYLEKYR